MNLQFLNNDFYAILTAFCELLCLIYPKYINKNVLNININNLRTENLTTVWKFKFRGGKFITRLQFDLNVWVYCVYMGDCKWREIRILKIGKYLKHLLFCKLLCLIDLKYVVQSFAHFNLLLNHQNNYYFYSKYQIFY